MDHPDSPCEVVQRYRSHWLRRRGPSSINNPVPTKVYFDGMATPYGSLRVVHEIRVANVASIRHFDAPEAHFKFGIGTVADAVLVRTKSRAGRVIATAVRSYYSAGAEYRCPHAPWASRSAVKSGLRSNEMLSECVPTEREKVLLKCSHAPIRPVPASLLRPEAAEPPSLNPAFRTRSPRSSQVVVASLPESDYV